MASPVPSAVPTASTTQPPAFNTTAEGGVNDAQASATGAFFFLVTVSTAILLSNLYPRIASAVVKRPYGDISKWKRRTTGAVLLLAIGGAVAFFVSVLFTLVNGNSSTSVSATSLLAAGIAVLIAAAAYTIVVRVDTRAFSREALIRNGIGLGIGAVCLIAANQWAHSYDRAGAGYEIRTKLITVGNQTQPKMRTPIRSFTPRYLGKNDSATVSMIIDAPTKIDDARLGATSPFPPCTVRLDPELTTLGLKTGAVPSAPVEFDATAPPSKTAWSWVVIPVQEGRQALRFSMLYEVRGGRDKRCHAGDKGSAYAALQYVEVVAPFFSDSFAGWLALIATTVGIVSTIVGLFRGKDKPEPEQSSKDDEAASPSTEAAETDEPGQADDVT